MRLCRQSRQCCADNCPRKAPTDKFQIFRAPQICANPSSTLETRKTGISENIGPRPNIAQSWVYDKVWGGVCCKLKVELSIQGGAERLTTRSDHSQAVVLKISRAIATPLNQTAPTLSTTRLSCASSQA